MKDLLWTLFELGVNLYQQAIIVRTLAICLGRKLDKKRHRKYTLWTIGILFIELSWLNHILPFEGLGVLITILILYLYAERCLCGQRLQKIFWCTSIVIMVLGITAVVLNLESSIIGCTYLQLVQGKTVERFAGVLVIQMIIFLILWIVSRIFGKDHHLALDWKKWILILAVPLISIFTMAFVTGIVVNVQNELSLLQQKFAVMAVLGIMITNVMVYVLYQKLQKEHEKQLNYEMLKQTMHSQENSAEELQELYLSIRKIEHNLKSQVMMVLSMLEENQYEQAQKYLETYNVEVLKRTESKVFCMNEIVNHLINTKYRLCLKAGIQMFVLMCNSIPPVSNVDLCILLGNALDNAIEGCASETEREIYLEMRLVDNFFMIQIKNTIIASVLGRNPDLKTTKEEKPMHGLGILSMKEVAGKYNGSVEFYEENDFFCCDVMLDIGDIQSRSF